MINIISKTDLETCIYRVRNAGDKKRPDDKYNKASVLVLFINDEMKKNSSILMIKRKDNLRKHAGQIAFPGGRKEKEDLNLEETAIRETKEEINIYKEHYSLIGNLPKFFTGTGYVVTPFVGIIKSNSPRCVLMLSIFTESFWPKDKASPLILLIISFLVLL